VFLGKHQGGSKEPFDWFNYIFLTCIIQLNNCLKNCYKASSKEHRRCLYLIIIIIIIIISPNKVVLFNGRILMKDGFEHVNTFGSMHGGKFC
jgi:hypothetical protein